MSNSPITDSHEGEHADFLFSLAQGFEEDLNFARENLAEYRKTIDSLVYRIAELEQNLASKNN